GAGALGIGPHQNLELARMHQLLELCRDPSYHCLRDFAEPFCVARVVRAPRCFLDQCRAFERFTAQSSDASFECGRKFMLPTGKGLNRGYYSVFVNRTLQTRTG